MFQERRRVMQLLSFILAQKKKKKKRVRSIPESRCLYYTKDKNPAWLRERKRCTLIFQTRSYLHTPIPVPQGWGLLFLLRRKPGPGQGQALGDFQIIAVLFRSVPPENAAWGSFLLALQDGILARNQTQEELLSRGTNGYP